MNSTFIDGESTAQDTYNRIQSLLTPIQSLPKEKLFKEPFFEVSDNIVETNKSYADNSNSGTFNSANRPPLSTNQDNNPPLSTEKLHEIYFHDAIYSFVSGKENANYSFEKNVLTPADAARQYESITKKCMKDRGHSAENDLSVLKVESDFWSLLEILTKANLLDDINEDLCDIQLNSNLSETLVSLSSASKVSIQDIIEQSYAVDDRVKKGAVLKEWIEKAASDSVGAIATTYREPWSATLDRILAEKSRPTDKNNRFEGKEKITSVDPDGQFSNELSSSSALLLPLDGVDRPDQETLLKHIWQLIRCGRLVEAQQVAVAHGVYWLTGSIIGVAYHNRPEAQTYNDDGDVVLSRVGNQRQPIWQRSCWRYADKLAANPENWSSRAASDTAVFDLISPPLKKNRSDDSLVGILEMSIYAALSNNTKVLMRSPIISTWHDRLWVLLKAVHERDISKIVHRYRCLKLQHSSLFPGCSEQIVAAEREVIELSMGDIGHMSTGDCQQILKRVSPSAQNDVESIILRLQAALIIGRSGIEEYIQHTLVDYLSKIGKGTNKAQVIAGHATILRVFCHFCIWLKSFDDDHVAPFNPSSESKNEANRLSQLASDEVLFLAVEAYVDHLIENDQPHLVASYVTYLSRARRITMYAQLLRNLQSQQKKQRNGSLDDTADEQIPTVLLLANVLFEEDVIEITRAVAERPIARPIATGDGSMESHGFLPSSNLVIRRDDNQLLSSSAIKSVRFQIDPSHDNSSIDGGFVATVLSPVSSTRDAEATTPQFGYSSLPRVKGRVAIPRNLRRSGPSRFSTRKPHTTTTEEEEPENVKVEETSTLPIPEHANEVLYQRIESLRWLYYDPIHRFEAVRQTNRMVLHILSHDDLSLLPLLRRLVVTGDYLPLNSISIGYSQLQQRKENLDEMISPTLYEHFEGRPSSTPLNDKFGGFLFSQSKRLNTTVDAQIENYRASLELYEQIWEAQVSQLELWKLFVGAFDDVAAVNQIVTEFRDARARCVGNRTEVSLTLSGRFGSKMNRAAELATRSLLRTIRCESESPESRHTSNGYKDVWDQAQRAAMSSLQALLSSLKSLPSQTDTESMEDGSVSLERNAMIEECYAVAALIENVPLDVIAGAGQQAVLDELKDIVESQLPRIHLESRDTELDASKLLGQCRQCLIDLIDGWNVRSNLLNSILTAYIKVCNDTAVVLEMLDFSSLDVARWYSLAVRLADVIANDEDSLRLHEILKRGDLKALLDSISSAAFNVLKLDPHYQQL